MWNVENNTDADKHKKGKRKNLRVSMRNGEQDKVITRKEY